MKLTRITPFVGALGALLLVFSAVPGVANGAESAMADAATSWPTPTSSQAVSASIPVKSGQVYDGGMKRFYGTGALGSGGQNEGQDPIFDLAAGATLKNVIIGSPAADGVHCAGSCTLENVWWEDVGEDAATFRGSSSSNTYLVNGGGARKASDKVFQHNGAGTLTIQNFQVNDFGKLYRSCGNCSTQYKRNVVLKNVTVTVPGKTLVGINSNYGDTAKFSGITIVGDSSKKIVICQKYIGNNTGAEPPTNGKGPDSTNCLYTTSNITYK
ncbi:pectate lyase [Chloroflexia bacterium SDU3-3]|nr:pectate lyase [Chloroflexia bacterium SDU3-3]